MAKKAEQPIQAFLDGSGGRLAYTRRGGMEALSLSVDGSTAFVATVRAGAGFSVWLGSALSGGSASFGSGMFSAELVANGLRLADNGEAHLLAAAPEALAAFAAAIS